MEKKDEKYYTLHVKILSTKNSDLEIHKLSFCYTGHEYERISDFTTFNDIDRYECIETFKESLYEIKECYQQCDNIIYEKKEKNKCVKLLNDEPLYLEKYSCKNNIKEQIIDEKIILTIGLYKKENGKYIFVRNSKYCKDKDMFVIF